jgi:hypothetical protein
MTPRTWLCLVVALFLVVPGWPRAPAPIRKKPPKTFTNSVGMKLVLVPAGKFTMGSAKEEKDRSDDEKQHEVTITRDFYLGVRPPCWRSRAGAEAVVISGVAYVVSSFRLAENYVPFVVSNRSVLSLASIEDEIPGLSMTSDLRPCRCGLPDAVSVCSA